MNSSHDRRVSIDYLKTLGKVDNGNEIWETR